MTHSETYKRILNRMGYYNYQQGLIYRHLNQEGGWDNHLENCRKFILKALDYYKPDKVTVLGSGWLLEVPLAEMLETTGEIVLVDIIHPPEVIQQAGNLAKVTLSEQDVTGGLIENVWKSSRKRMFFKKRASRNTIEIPEYRPPDDPGLVVSLNILTQLEILPVSFLKRSTGIKDEELSDFRSEIQKKHILFLKKHNSVLITDTSEVFTEDSGKTLYSSSLLAEIPEGRYKEEWIWNFDLLKSDYYNKKSILNVTALIL
jgi:hypothetical protein